MRLLRLPLLCLLPAAASAQSFDAVLVPAQSAAHSELASRLETAGTLIGDHDPDTRPDGTQTRPGLFGGSGNNPIPATVDLDTDASGDTAPSGAFAFELDFVGLQGTLDGLVLDLLDGDTVPASATATLLFADFNTINPTAIYPGGFPVEVALGDVGEITAADLVQTGPTPSLLTATGDPDVFEFSVAIPADLYLVVLLTPPDAEPTELPLEPIPFLLPAAGTLTRTGNGNWFIDAATTPVESSGEIPLEGEPLAPIPLELPTLGSETASVILNLNAESLTFSVTLELDMHALATPAPPPGLIFWNGFEQATARAY